MKQHWPKLLGVVVVLVAGFLFYRWYFPPDEKVIRERIKILAGNVSIAGKEGNIAKVTAANRVKGCFVTNVVINLENIGYDLPTITSSEEVFQLVMAARANFSQLNITMQAVEVDIGADGQTAQARLSAVVSMERRSEPLIQELKMSLVKQDRKWLISQVEPVQGIKLEAVPEQPASP